MLRKSTHVSALILPLLNLAFLPRCTKILESPEDFTGFSDTIFDIEGNSYKTIGIGTQIWMDENLRTTSLNDGRILTRLNSIWVKTPGYCYYNYDSVQSDKIYGLLYNFYALSHDSLCPTGWHIPSEKDWVILTNYLGGSKAAGGKLKDSSGNYWDESNVYFPNNYNFCAIPGGILTFDINDIELFADKGNKGYWWTSTVEASSDHWAKAIILSNSNTNLKTEIRYTSEALSIRCIKNK